MVATKEKWKVGDKCFYEANKGKIDRLKDGRVFGFESSFGHHGGDLTDKCFPITDETTRLSTFVKEQYDIIRKSALHLNFPAISHHVYGLWAEMCQAALENNDAEVKSKMAILESFTLEVQKIVFQTQVQGIKLFRPH